MSIPVALDSSARIAFTIERVDVAFLLVCTPFLAQPSPANHE